MYSVLNCYNVAQHPEFYLGQLRLNVTSTGNTECLKPLQWYSKCYFVASVKKTFKHKGVILHNCLP
jgi:hypothetical protein